jgi:hypothetical protein
MAFGELPVYEFQEHCKMAKSDAAAQLGRAMDPCPCWSDLMAIGSVDKDGDF